MTLDNVPGEHQIARGPYRQQHYNSHEFGRDRERPHSE
jgi:hypothetical protein